jgi:hypothetical protein
MRTHTVRAGCGPCAGKAREGRSPVHCRQCRQGCHAHSEHAGRCQGTFLCFVCAMPTYRARVPGSSHGCICRKKRGSVGCSWDVSWLLSGSLLPLNDCIREYTCLIGISCKSRSSCGYGYTTKRCSAHLFCALYAICA